jgi:O-antigen/teichoic acid export membrane protein
MSGRHRVVRRVAVGTASNVAGQTVVLVTRIILAALIVRAVGAKEFGIWALISAIASLGFLLELGISAGLVKYVAEHAARRETDEAAQMVGAAKGLYALLASAVCVIGVGLGLVLPTVLGVSPDIARTARLLATLICVDVAVAMLAVAPIAVLKGLQRFPAVNTLTSIGAVSNLVLTLVVLWMGAGIVGITAASTVNSIAFYVFLIVAVRRIAPEYMATPLRRDAKRARRLLRFSRSIAVIQVSITLQTRLDAIVIGAALPVRLVTPYSFAQRLSDGTGIATDQFGKLLLPLASEVSATQTPAAVRSLYLTASRLTLFISIGVGLPIALLGNAILTIWVGSSLSGHGTLVALLCAAAIVDLLSYPAAAVLQSIERHGPVAWMALGSGMANLVLSIALVRRFGVAGVAAATLIATTVEILGFVLPYAARVLDVSLREFITVSVLPLVLPVLVLVVLTIGGAALIPVTSLFHLFIVVAVAACGYAITYVAFGAATDERAAYRAALEAALQHRPRPDPRVAATETSIPPEPSR